MKYEVYFSIFGKEMKSTVEAITALEAKEKIKEAIVKKIEFYQFKPIDVFDDNDVFNFLGGFKNK